MLWSIYFKWVSLANSTPMMLILESNCSKKEFTGYNKLMYVLTWGNNGRDPTQRGGHVALAEGEDVREVLLL